MTDELCFIDCETTGLDPERHVPWEIGLSVGSNAREWEWILELTPEEGARADPNALRLTDYYERVAEASGRMGEEIASGRYVSVAARRDFALRLIYLIGQRHLAGNIVSFDARMVGDFLRRQGYVPVWHYHLIDVECVAAGRLGVAPPWDSEDLSRALGVDPDAFGRRHSALADARWAKAVYEAAMTPVSAEIVS